MAKIIQNIIQASLKSISYNVSALKKCSCSYRNIVQLSCECNRNILQLTGGIEKWSVFVVPDITVQLAALSTVC
jgi:hypothetical protein